VRVRERTAKLEAEVDQRRRAEERLKYLALHDGLTGLANRNLLRQRMAKIVDQVVADDQVGAVIFIDLDRFKNVNDTLGHRVGDMLLKEVAKRLTGAVRSCDVVARLGGDEFVIVAGPLDERGDAETIAQKVHDSLQQPIRVQQHELFATPSIGIALFPRDDISPDALVQMADAAMYQAKSEGRNTTCFFDPTMTASTEHYLRTESSLRKAIDRREFEPYYQPIVDLRSGACVSLELLVRWQHPELGLVSPATFIPIAEDSGLVARIGALVLESACRQFTGWREMGFDVPRFALNLSALQFRDPRHIEAISGTLAAHGMASTQIELEITETALMQDGEQTLAILQSLSAAGFSLSVDDFGTGYSSLSYLKRFPVGKLKIDKSFIQDMTKDPNDEAIVRMIIALAKTLRIATVAEGVETVAQSEALRRLGCDFAQGYLFARPLSAAQLQASPFLGRDAVVRLHYGGASNAS
jgi:diguanylate cyclase (GGDEF)-like protein